MSISVLKYLCDVTLESCLTKFSGMTSFVWESSNFETYALPTNPLMTQFCLLITFQKADKPLKYPRALIRFVACLWNYYSLKSLSRFGCKWIADKQKECSFHAGFSCGGILWFLWWKKFKPGNISTWAGPWENVSYVICDQHGSHI